MAPSDIVPVTGVLLSSSLQAASARNANDNKNAFFIVVCI
jgi:hypothetical protein